MLSDFVKYVKQYWHDRPDKSTPLNADRLNHIENGIGSNSEAINQIANAVVSNIVNDPDKIASMAAVYALQEKLGTGELPSDAPNAISAINTLYSNFLQAAICVVAAQDNTMTFTLKRPTGTDIRFTALVFLSNQSFNFIGAYAIGINRKTEVIAKIVGDTAATIKRIDDYTVTITFETYAIWSNGLAIIPKELL